MVECRFGIPNCSSACVDPPKGMLLHGPPGTGKTRLARAVANESDANSFTSPARKSWLGLCESEKKLRELFEHAAESAPSIIFIDESIRSLPAQSGHWEAEKRLVAQLLEPVDGLEPRQNLVVIAATNRPEAIDERFAVPVGSTARSCWRPRREAAARFRHHTRGMPLIPT